MIATITAPFVDTRAADLVLSLAEPELPAEAVCSLQAHGAQVALRLLRASHQVVVRREGRELIETLACLPAGHHGLPGRYETTSAAGGYATVVDTHDLPAAELARLVTDLLAQYADDERFVIGQFPGHPLATTGVGLVDSVPGVVAWRSWHAYPQERRIVLTRSELRLRVGDRMSAGVGR